jgi:hypothetical protein
MKKSLPIPIPAGSTAPILIEFSPEYSKLGKHPNYNFVYDMGTTTMPGEIQVLEHRNANSYIVAIDVMPPVDVNNKTLDDLILVIKK